MIDLIRDLTPEKGEKNAKEILDFYHTFESGRASEEVANYIHEHIASHR